MQRQGYRPGDYLERNPELRAALDLIADGRFSRGDREMFRPLVDNLRNSDPFFVLADFAAYVAAQERAAAAWLDRDALDADVDRQCRLLREVFVGPLDSRVRDTDLDAASRDRLVALSFRSRDCADSSFFDALAHVRRARRDGRNARPRAPDANSSVSKS